LSCWFGRKKWLKDLIDYILRKTLAEPFVILFIFGEGMGWEAWLP
jgi:hypothetical protein